MKKHNTSSKSHWLLGGLIAGTLASSIGGHVYSHQEMTKQMKQIKSLQYQMKKQEKNMSEQQKYIRSLLEQQKEQQMKYEKQQNQYEELLKRLDRQEQEIKSLRKEVSLRRQPVEKPSTKTVRTSSRGPSAAKKTLVMEATAYVALCKEGCTGKTATGINLLENPHAKVIAVDPSIIPLGSKVWVEGYGYAIAGDTGGGIKGYEIDVYMPSERDAIRWGRRMVKVKILD